MGQHHIENADMKFVFHELADGILAIVDPNYIKIVNFEIGFQYSPETEIVFNQKNMGFGIHLNQE
jgi:hypothetical protein